MKIKEIKKMRFDFKINVETLNEEAFDRNMSPNELLIDQIRNEVVEYQKYHNFLIDMESEIKIDFFGNLGMSEYTCILSAIEVIKNINIVKAL